MTTIPANPMEVSALCKEMSIFGVKLNRKTAVSLLRQVGDRHLCADALLMNPRPGWLEDIVGPINKG